MKSKHIIKIVCFVAIAVLLFQLITQIMTPKYLYDNPWPTTQTFVDFYDLEEDSVDVLFLGGSHMVNAFSPLELYENYGISSYNLGSDQQSLPLSYYWLKEALRFQSPQVVVLDVSFLYLQSVESPLNASEAAQRKTLDYMKWSSVKMEAVDTVCEQDETQSKWSYYFPMIRYHERWTELSEDDFTYDSSEPHQALMGYSALSEYCVLPFEPFASGSTTEVAEPLDLMQEYMNQIVQLCNENEIDLILVSTPTSEATIEEYNYVSQYAEENDLLYIDFNEESVYTAIDYDFGANNRDYAHANLWGAEKITNYIGEILVDEYQVTTGTSEQHEELLDYYAEIKKECNLRWVTDIYEYLDLINDANYAVIISFNEDGTSALDDSLKEKLASLGTTVDFNNASGCSYYVVINGDVENERLEQGTLIETNGTLRDGAVAYEINSSAGNAAGGLSNIVIDGEDYAVNSRGMNIVVYSLSTKQVIDSVCFDTGGDLSATREFSVDE